MKSYIETLVRFLTRRAAWVAGAGLVLAIVGTYFTAQLYQNLRTDIEELLPTTARSVIDLNEVTGRLESSDNLVVLVFSKHPRESKKFVTDLAEKLKAYPKDVIASVEYRMTDEINFFKKRRALYLDLEDLYKIRDYAKYKVTYERALRNPINLLSKDDIPKPHFDAKEMEKKYAARTSGMAQFPDGYYASSDEFRRAIVVNMPGKLSNMDKAIQLTDAIKKSVAELKPASYAPDLEVRYTGNVQNLIEEHGALIEDLTLSTVLVVFLVALAMLMFYRNVRATLALLISLFMGTLWTFGIAYFAVGFLNANSAFLASIVIGNGINFGIIFLARYVEERRLGKSNEEALRLAISLTFIPTVTAAMAAGLSYGSLILTGFRGFHQFGVIGLVGMVLCWISAFTVMPAILTLFERIKPLEAAKVSAPPKAYLTAAVASMVSKYPKVIWGVSLALIVLSLSTFVKYDSEGIIETDLTKLRDKKSMETGSGSIYHHIDEIFQRYLSPIVIMPQTADQAREMKRRFDEKKAAEGKDSLVAAVHTIYDFIPDHQAEKIKVIKEIKHMLPPKQLAKLTYNLNGEVLTADVVADSVLVPITPKDLPEAIVSKFREKNGEVGRLVLVDKTVSHGDEDSIVLNKFVHSLREIADSVAPGAPVVGQLPVVSDMVEAVRRDGPRATQFALIAVVLLVIVIFHNVRIVGLALFGLSVGVVWLVGIILGFDLKINFLNFIALPITFGIGVDYGVNIFQRYQVEGRGSILKVIRSTGGAVGLCSLTTVIGYASLLIAGNRALFSFGRLAVLGELTCTVAAIVSLPALLVVLDKRRERKRAGNAVSAANVGEPRMMDSV